MNGFHYTFQAQDVVFGAGALARLGDLTERYGWRRLMLCVGAGARSRGHVASVEQALGGRLVATYEGVRPHVHESQVSEALTMAIDSRSDALIGLGGGSAIGTAKAVSHELGGERCARGDVQRDPSSVSPLAVPIVAIPTTYAGSEMTSVFGVTEHSDGVARKVTRSNPLVMPRLTIYDPELTMGLPPRVTAGSGINAVAHCIEALYSITRNPLSTAAASEGLRLITHSLPRAYDASDDLEARTQTLAAAYLAGTALANVAMGLHHGLCHVLGGTAGIAHGDANSVILPHAMRFNLAGCAPQLALAAAAMGRSTDDESPESAGEAAIEQVSVLVERMNLPRRLRDVGVRAEELPELARMAFASRTVQNNPTPIADAAEIEGLLREAW